MPAADWTQRADLAALVAALGVDTMRWVGGAVRDTLLGHPVKDIDAATTLTPDEVIAACSAASLRTVPTGIDHGTVTVVLPGGPVEVTTLRHDVSTDGRRATVAFASDWRDDAARRDFTINALYAHPVTLAIDDYFGGLEDLQAGRVRFIGDARQRIREDHLRILRYFRFQARFGSAIDAEADAACADLAATLKGLSRERVAMELLALLALPDPVATLQRMDSLGVLAMVLPEATLTTMPALVAAEAACGIAPAPLRRMAALLPADPPLVDKVAARLKLSTAQRKHLATLASRASGDVRALAYRHGIEAARDLALLGGTDPAPLADWTVPELPLKGGEIVQRGVGAGPQVARVLRAVEARWVAEGFPPRPRVEALLAEELDSSR
nr:CCA tRNA nucleotidyltransferase [Alteraurantiacibacter buctensis]